MNLSISGHHLSVTPALRNYVTSKLDRITRHFDSVIDMQVLLSVDKLDQRAEINLHVRGKDIFCSATKPDLYEAIDRLIDKLDRKVVEYKRRRSTHSRESLKHQLVEH